MHSRYEQLEDEIALLLQGNAGFDAAVLPDNNVFEFKTKCQVFVMYNNSDFSESDNIALVSQKEKAFIGIEFRCAVRRGTSGIFAAQKVVFDKLLGHKSLGCDKMNLVSFGPLEGSKPGQWSYFALFSTNTSVNEVYVEPVEPLFVSASFLKPV